MRTAKEPPNFSITPRAKIVHASRAKTGTTSRHQSQAEHHQAATNAARTFCSKAIMVDISEGSLALEEELLSLGEFIAESPAAFYSDRVILSRQHAGLE
mmetsp:Transcript_27505/g.37148  ORF Transcript_27505/g.37148 Transcript_27505/m.37148 type:complete len:99 (+) Transcript_27505:293-589(+)